MYKAKKNYHKRLESLVAPLSALQRLDYASNRYAVLLILQGMDAAGTDGAIRQVMSRVNRRSCQVFSFKQPSAEEMKHDVLWRATCRLPERGRSGICNRYYYEEVLIVRVHPELLGGKGLPETLLDEKTIGKGRCRASASARLSAMDVRSKPRVPWAISFSLARAIQQTALEIWRSNEANVLKAQQALYHRARCNQAARRREDSAAMEGASA